MQVVFMGTPEFAVPSLKALINAGHAIQAVVTQPDRPSGRGMKLKPPAAKTCALEMSLPVLQPTKVSDPIFVDTLRRLQPDVIAVVAFGQLIPTSILYLPRFGCVNVHPSLLPEYRGATPMQQAILDGKTSTGVTTMYLNEGLDSGDIILQETTPIFPTEDAGALHDRLGEAGAALLVKTLSLLGTGEAPRLPQNNGAASYCRKLGREDGLLDWYQESRRLANQVRAFSPWPGAFTFRDQQRLKVWQAFSVAQKAPDEAEPGEIVSVGHESLEVACGEGVLALAEVQPANSKRMSGADYARGRKIAAGDKFDLRAE